MDYYDILHVKRTASCREIKQAYRDLAKKYHPDKNLNKDFNENEDNNNKFINIHTAYTILTDDVARKEYDSQYTQPDIFQNLNIHKLFNSTNNDSVHSALLNDFIFNNTECIINFNYEKIQSKMIIYFQNNFKNMCLKYNIEARILSKLMNTFTNNNKCTNTSQCKVIEPRNIEYTIKVTIDQIFQNKVKKIQVLRKIKCDKCNGSLILHKCNNCNKTANNNIICNYCFQTSFSEIKCDCDNGYIMSSKLFEIKLNNTILHNSKIIFEGDGDYLHNYSKQGNIVIYINYEKHTDFEVRDKIHLIIEKILSLYEWLFEYNIEIYHPSNEIIPLYNSGYVTKQLIKIPNKGLVCDNITGNLYIILKLDTTNIDHDEIYNRFKPHNIIDDLIVSETPECSDSISEYKN